MDQLPDGLAGPQRRGDLQLLRRLGLDRPPDGLLLFPAEEAAGADRSSGAIPGESPLAPMVVSGAPPGDGLLTDPQDGRDIADGVAQLTGMHRTSPQGVEAI